MELSEKQLQALKGVFSSVNRLDLYFKILGASGRKQKRDVTVMAFKALGKELPKNDTALIRQLAELTAQVNDDTLREQLEAVMSELFSADQKSVPARMTKRLLGRKRPLRFNLSQNPTKPKAFDWSRRFIGKA